MLKRRLPLKIYRPTCLKMIWYPPLINPPLLKLFGTALPRFAVLPAQHWWLPAWVGPSATREHVFDPLSLLDVEFLARVASIFQAAFLEEHELELGSFLSGQEELIEFLDTTYGETLRQRQESMFLLKSALKAVTESASDILAGKQSEDLPSKEKEELSKALADASAAALSKVCQTNHLCHADCLFLHVSGARTPCA